MAMALAITPPMHQDFRARQTMCSPGDGWRAYKPPPPLVLAKEFHFLAPLLLPEAYAYAQPRPKERPVLDRRFHGKLAGALRLPVETLSDILNLVVEEGSGSEIAQVSHAFHDLTLHRFYRAIHLRTAKSVALLNRTLDGNPALGDHIRTLRLDAHRLPWDQLDRLALLLEPVRLARIEDLSIRIPASDLPLALPFLMALQPKRFTWATSPCWQMRPAHLFVQLFAAWQDSLQWVTLENFCFDQTLLQCMVQLPHLQTLTLRGSGSERLSTEVLQGLLCSDDAASSLLSDLVEEARPPLQVEVAHCSPARRASVESELQASVGNSPFRDPLSQLSWG